MFMHNEWNQKHTSITSLQLKIQIEATLENTIPIRKVLRYFHDEKEVWWKITQLSRVACQLPFWLSEAIQNFPLFFQNFGKFLKHVSDEAPFYWKKNLNCQIFFSINSGTLKKQLFSELSWLAASVLNLWINNKTWNANSARILSPNFIIIVKFNYILHRST